MMYCGRWLVGFRAKSGLFLRAVRAEHVAFGPRSPRSYLLLQLVQKCLVQLRVLPLVVVQALLPLPPHVPPVGLGVDPLEHGRQHLAHVHEVQDVDGDAEDRVHDGGDLAGLGARVHVAVPDHGDHAARKEEVREMEKKRHAICGKNLTKSPKKLG